MRFAFVEPMIISKTNSRIKKVRLLRQAKHRGERGEYFIEGIKLLEEALKEEASVREVYYSPQLERSPRGVELLSRAREVLPGAGWEYVSDTVLDSIADTQSHQGILAVLKKPECGWQDFEGRKGLLLLLYELQDPGNLGTILRTGDAGGAAGIVLSTHTVDPYSPKVVRAAMGSLFRIPVLIGQEMEESVHLLRSRGFRVLAAAMDGGQTIWETNFSEPSAVLLGQEGGGLPQKLVSLCNGSFRIPMRAGVDSLNVAITAGLAVYEAMRQRKADTETG